MRVLSIVAVVLVVSLYVCDVIAVTGDTFTVNCQPLTQQRTDPIVFPGVAGAHVHSIVGGNAFQRSMPDVDSATDATATTCDKSQDHSNYWVPQMYHYRTEDGMFELVKWIGSATYYQKRACDYAPGQQVCNSSFIPLAPPEGLRMLAGNPFRRTQNDSDFAQRAISIMCIWNGGSQQYTGFPPRQCDLMRGQVYFPSCWDGINADTPNHQDHMAYPAIGDYNIGVCPQSHPVAIFSVFFEFFFDTSPYQDINRYAFACGDPTGYGFHGDYMFGWTNRTNLQNAHRDCVTAANCPTLGMQQPGPQPLIYPAIYPEPIGLDGPIKSLPGNNPVVFSTKTVAVINE